MVLTQRKDRKMFRHERVNLFASCCFVSDGVQGTFDVINCHAILIAMIDGYPPKAYPLESFF